MEPRAYSEAMAIAKRIIAGEATLVNFHLVEEKQARRIVDFLTGTVYALDGDIKRVGDEIFLVHRLGWRLTVQPLNLLQMRICLICKRRNYDLYYCTITSFTSTAAYFYSIILMVYALLSWFPGGYQSGLGRLLAKICEPYISLFDRLPLRIGPLDFTILGAILILNLAVQGLAQIVIWITVHLVY